MVLPSGGHRRPPRFVVRVLTASLTTVVLVLAAVVAGVMLYTRHVVETGLVASLESSQRFFATIERERQHQAAVQASVLTGRPGLTRALEQLQGGGESQGEARAAAIAGLQQDVEALEAMLFADVVAAIDVHQRVLAAAGPYAHGWRDQIVPVEDQAPVAFQAVFGRDRQPFATIVAPVYVKGTRAGYLAVGTLLDEHYAARLATLARSGVSIVLHGRVIAGAPVGPQRAAFERAARPGLPSAGEITLEGERFAYRRLRELGPVGIYAIDSITQATSGVVEQAMPMLVGIAVGGLVLCLLASARLAHTVSAPIDRLSRELSAMADAHDTIPLLKRHATSREIDTLAETFNRLIASLTSARAETDAAVVGAIRALAAALDARDAYTAGHSERVSALSLAIGRQMHVSDADLEVLRLGAILHDIGKIGISDNILGKAGPLTEDEYEIIKTHPVLGAQILRTVPFLEPHLPIVELHHEQPDGLGYPYGLRGDQIPLLARIVHVADAFDAMTTARAYRAGRPAPEALAVLWRHAGTQFDLDVVRGLSAALPEFLGALPAPREERKPADVVPFERRAAEG